MGDRTAIEWAANADGSPGSTWNPIIGCQVHTPGCTNCYAMAAAGIGRLAGTAKYAGLTRPTKAGPVWTGEVRLWERALAEPMRRRKPTTWFVNSMGDLGAEGVDDAWLDRVWAVMALSPQHTFIVLTKRPERLRAYISQLDEYSLEEAEEWRVADNRVTCDDDPEGSPAWHAQTARLEAALEATKALLTDRKPLPNVWLGVTVEDQERASQRIPELLATPAAVRLVSYEPAIGPLHLRQVRKRDDFGKEVALDTLTGEHLTGRPRLDDGAFRDSRFPRLDWVICGGESGPKARPMHPDWARQVRDDCAAAGVPFFFKQWGEWAPDGFFECDESAFWAYRGELLGMAGHESGPAYFAFPEVYRPKPDLLRRVGKRRAGRLLDGALHDARPPLRGAAA